MFKYKIGYTTGVFDVFHIGHLNLLKAAKDRCEKLIVGVSTDENVKSYKHKKPIIPFKERIEIVNSLKCVDKVVAQESMDKVEAWRRLRYDVLFHGTDWKDSDMYNNLENELKKYGVDVVYLPHTEGVSSTLLADVLRNLYEEQ